MTTDQIKELIRDKQIIDFQTDDQDFAHGLRLVLRDIETGEMGLLAVEPCELTMPDEIVLDYSYQVLSKPDTPHFDECDYNFTPEPPVEGQQGLFG